MSSSPYLCTLDEASQKKAAEELNEDPKNRQGAIDTFRQWILQQKHFTCPTDDVFLLAFLRARKFSQLEARRLLENFLKRREKLPDWFKNLDPAGPEFQKALDSGVILILPGRDKDGRKVFMLRPGYINVSDKKFSKNEVFRMMATALDYIHLCNETTQVNGTVTLVDMSRITMAHQTKVSLEDRKNFIQTWQKNYPARIKAFHMYNPGTFMEFMMMVIKVAMSEKIQKRLIIHGTSLESVYKQVPQELLPEEYLEDDYKGKCAGSEASIIAQMKEEFSKPEVRDRLRYLSSKEFSINMKEKDSDVPAASFRKLNVD